MTYSLFDESSAVKYRGQIKYGTIPEKVPSISEMSREIAWISAFSLSYLFITINVKNQRMNCKGVLDPI